MLESIINRMAVFLLHVSSHYFPSTLKHIISHIGTKQSNSHRLLFLSLDACRWWGSICIGLGVYEVL